MNTKLIIIEGIPGSGKTTTATYIKHHLEESGSHVKLYQEGNPGHPADYEFTSCLNHTQFRELLTKYPKEQDLIMKYTKEKEDWYFIQYHELGKEDGGNSLIADDLASYDVYELNLETYEKVSYNYWEEFINDTNFGNTVYIFECCFLQNPFTKFIAKHNAGVPRLEHHLSKIGSLINPLNPLLVYLYQDDIRKSFKQVFEERDPGWRDFFTDYHMKNGYGKDKHLTGFNGLVEYLEMRRDEELRLIDSMDMRKLLIKNDEKDWEEYNGLINRELSHLE
ncbi:hypothetical protein [Rossellomorea sp. y25]|uniref:hypothetical protein n=1 Tax=Rossellomorea sp. y25 TaxID=3118174 RepID=UPI0030E1709B